MESLKKENHPYSGGQFKGGRMVITEVDSLIAREKGHVTEVVSLMEGEWSRYRSGHFNGGKMVMLQRWSVQEGRMVMLQSWPV